MEKMDKKNESKQEHLNKKKLMQEQMAKKMAHTNELLNIGKGDIV